MSRQFLVTGGSGFLGAALVRRLVLEGHRVRIFDNGFRSGFERLKDIENQIETISGDIRDLESVSAAIEGVDSVIHLAAINGTKYFYEKPELVLDVGVRGMLNILEGCKKHNVGDLVLASSSEVYQTPPQIPTDETTPLIVPDVLNPRYSYGGSKIISELLAINYGRSHFDRIAIFRPHNVYGPDMGLEHVIPEFILRAHESISKHPIGLIPFLIQGDGKQTRSFIHIDDMIDGLMLIIEKGVHQNIYHVGNPEEITIAQVAEKIFRYLGRDMQLETKGLLAGSTERRCPDIKKLKSLGFSPKISFDKGLPSVIDWYLSKASLNC